MQSGDQIKETLTTALGVRLTDTERQRILKESGVSRPKDSSAQTSSKNSFTMSETDSPRTSFTLKTRDTSDGKSNINSKKSTFAQKTSDDVLDQNSKIYSLNPPIIGFDQKRNPVSEGPMAYRQRRSTAVKRQDTHQATTNSQNLKLGSGMGTPTNGISSHQPTGSLRTRLFSQDVQEITLRRLEQARKYKKQAQKLYKNGDYFDALTLLHKAVKTFKVQNLSADIKLESEEAYEIIKDCYLFSASCYVKINQFDSAIQLMSELIEAEESNLKALYLRGKAYYQRNEIMNAYTDFQTGLNVEPLNSILTQQVKEIENNYPDIKVQYQQSLQSQKCQTIKSVSDHHQEDNVETSIGEAQSYQTSLKNQEVFQPTPLKQSRYFSMNSTTNSSGDSHNHSTERVVKSVQVPFQTIQNTQQHLNHTFLRNQDSSIQHPSSPSKIRIDDIIPHNSNNFNSNCNNQMSSSNSCDHQQSQNFNTSPRKVNNQSYDSDSSQKTSEKQKQMSIIDYIILFWKQHKPEIMQTVWTIVILLLIMLAKKIIVKITPDFMKEILKKVF
eukprot:403343395